ncbi:DUF6427 family protein [Empedobacter brevis]|uniref:DUF6427 family protein n=1 Tax=Empedobacter brevis TaxID=247 RepID=UPI0028A00DB5|nr:DUF6427 family protein [Empedobacter brevis]
MLVNLLGKRNFFIQIFIIILFTLFGAANFNSIDLSNLEKLGAILTLLTIAFVGYTDYRNDLISTSSYSTFVYILWIMPFIAGLSDYRISGSLLLITYVTAQLLYFESEKNDTYNAFDIGVFMSFAILLNPPLILLGAVVFTYFLTLRVVEPKIPILGILGFILPILIVAQVSFLLDYYFMLNFYKEQLMLRTIHFELKQLFLIPVIIILIYSIVNHFKNINKLTAQKKRIFLLMHLMFLAILITYLLYGGNNDTYLAFLGFSIMIMLTRFFSESKPKIEWLKEALLWIFMICLLIYNFYDRIPRFFSLITEVSF